MELDTNMHVLMLGTTAQKHQPWQTDEDANAQHSLYDFKGRGSRQIPQNTQQSSYVDIQRYTSLGTFTKLSFVLLDLEPSS